MAEKVWTTEQIEKIVTYECERRRRSIDRYRKQHGDDNWTKVGEACARESDSVRIVYGRILAALRRESK